MAELSHRRASPPARSSEAGRDRQCHTEHDRRRNYPGGEAHSEAPAAGGEGQRDLDQQVGPECSGDGRQRSTDSDVSLCRQRCRGNRSRVCIGKARRKRGEHRTLRTQNVSAPAADQQGGHQNGGQDEGGPQGERAACGYGIVFGSLLAVRLVAARAPIHNGHHAG